MPNPQSASVAQSSSSRISSTARLIATESRTRTMGAQTDSRANRSFLADTIVDKSWVSTTRSLAVAHASSAVSAWPETSATSCARTTSNPGERRSSPRITAPRKFSSASHFTGSCGVPAGDPAGQAATTFPDWWPKARPRYARALPGTRLFPCCASGNSR